MEKKEKSVIRQVGTINLPPLAGEQQGLYKYSEIFSAYLDPGLSLLVDERSTNETSVTIYQVMHSIKLLQAFIDIPGSWEDKTLSQGQILYIIQKHKELFFTHGPSSVILMFLCQLSKGSGIISAKNHFYFIDIENYESYKYEGLAINVIKLRDSDLYLNPEASVIKIITPNI